MHALTTVIWRGRFGLIKYFLCRTTPDIDRSTKPSWLGEFKLFFFYSND